MQTEALLASREWQYAGLWRRFFALVVDFMLLGLIFFPITRLIKGVWIMSTENHAWGYGWFITDPLCVAFLAAIFIYFVVCEGVLGATPGKAVLGLRVVLPDRGKVGVGRAVIRNLMRAIDALPAFNILGVVLIVTSPEKTRAGDRVAGTRVVLRKQAN